MPHTNWGSPEEQGTSPLPKSLRGLDRTFPEIVYLLYDGQNNRHVLMDAHHKYAVAPEAIADRFEGLACFSHFNTALITAYQLCGDMADCFEPIPIPFEMARDIAKQKTEGLGALILVEPSEHPLIHYIR